MNHESKPTLTITVHGQLTIERAQLATLFEQAPEPLVRESSRPRAEASQPIAMNPHLLAAIQPAESGVPRLAYTMRETAEILGLSYITVHRLLKRGLLRSSRAVRHKIIPRSEIERFLKETSRSVL